MSGQDSLGLLLHDAARLIRRRFEVEFADLGLSSAQWRLLVNLKHLGTATQARLAERLEIEPISVSRLIDRMEEAGWVRREADPTDRRSKVILPTAKTLKAFERGSVIAEKVYDEAMTGLPPEQRALLCENLRCIIRNLNDTPPPDMPPPEEKS